MITEFTKNLTIYVLRLFYKHPAIGHTKNEHIKTTEPLRLTRYIAAEPMFHSMYISHTK